MPIDPGTKLGPYEIVELLASGGMGEVYRARDPRLHRDVAVKTLQPHLTRDRESLDRFALEARAVAAIAHPNIMAVYDVGESGGTAYVVCELLEGETLRSRIIRGALPWREALDVASEIATGLAAAHAKGIVHGDLKPENVFLTSDGLVKILDFGLARLTRGGDGDQATVPTEPVVISQTVMGTVGYMAPEVLGGRQPAPASDLFALGCILHEMVAGRAPFSRDTPLSTIAAVVECEPPSLADVGKEVPDDVEMLVQRCLAKSPSARFRSAHDVALMLRTVVANPSRPRRAVVDTTPVAVTRQRLGSTFIVALAMLGIAIAAAGVWAYTHFRDDGPTSIAVLPFENATGSADEEYVADGITESLINSLSQIPSLSVRARASVFRFKGKQIVPERAARDLDADVVVTGRLLRHGDTLTLSAELVDASEGRQLWGGKYDRPADQLVDVQEEIARAVVERLRVDVSAPVQKQIEARRPESGDAYELYLRGRYYLGKRTEENFVKAISYFTRAIDRDPRFALGYSGLADCYLLLSGYGLRAPREVVPRAKAAAMQALRIEPNLAEPHATLAAIYSNSEFAWSRAEEEYRKAIALNPSYATARQWYAGFLTGQGRFAEAHAQLEDARTLDPLSLTVSLQIALAHYMNRRYDEALRAYEDLLELDPNFAPAHEYRGLVYQARGLHREAVAAEIAARRARGIAEPELANLQRAFDTGGFLGFKKLILGEALSAAKTGYFPPSELAALYCDIGETDAAFAELEKGVAERAASMVWLKHEPRYDPLRADPRYAGLLRKMNLR